MDSGNYQVQASVRLAELSFFLVVPPPDVFSRRRGAPVNFSRNASPVKTDQNSLSQV